MDFNDGQNKNLIDRTDTFETSNRKKRDLVYSDDIIYLYDDEEPEVSLYQPRKKRAVNMKMSLANATDYCRKTILNTDAAKVCLELSGVNASSAIQSCAADLQVWSFAYLSTLITVNIYFFCFLRLFDKFIIVVKKLYGEKKK